MAQIRDLPDETDWIADGEEASRKLATYNEDLEIQTLIKDINEALGYTADPSRTSQKTNDFASITPSQRSLSHKNSRASRRRYNPNKPDEEQYTPSYSREARESEYSQS